jgi:hypothetical protein
MESVLGHSPRETFRMEVMGELVTEFQRLEELCSWLEWPGMRICDLLLGPHSSRTNGSTERGHQAAWNGASCMVGGRH